MTILGDTDWPLHLTLILSTHYHYPS
jgi:hypothetical protein